MPPGSAKSTYISALFPPWFLAQKEKQGILACSYAKDLIQGFGRKARNIIELHEKDLGYSLRADTRAADEWGTTNGGFYFCAGVNAGIAGHRADLGFIDDPIGSDTDARSQLFRDNLWKWFWDDFMPRLKPGGSVIIVANRRHEDDLVGRLIANYPADWDLIKMPLVIDSPEQQAADPLGRGIGDRLWPEWFTEQTVADARKSDSFSGLHQQDPTPEDGEFFKKEWFAPVTYKHLDAMPKNLRDYVASDHALTTREENDSHCLIPFGIDANDDIWIYPDVFWERSDTLDLAHAMFDIVNAHRPIEWFAEDEHIHKAIGPFINKMMQEKNVYFTLTGIVSSKDLQTRAQSIRGRMKQLKIHLPEFAGWYLRAKQQLLSFPLGKHDDFVAALAKIGQSLEKIYGGKTPPPPPAESFNTPKVFVPTLGWLKKSHEKAQQKHLARYSGR